MARRVSPSPRVAFDAAPLIYFLTDAGERAQAVHSVLAGSPPGSIVVSVITEAELLVGALRSPGGERSGAIAALLASCDAEIVEVSRGIATEAARLRASLNLGLTDAIVAATALDRGCEALLSNDSAFRRLSDRLVYLHVDDLVEQAAGE